MAFRHRFPSTVMLIGYLEDAKRLSPTRHSGKKVIAKLYNPELGGKNRSFDLRVPVIALGKIADLCVEYSKMGDLVALNGRLVQIQSPKGFTVGVYVEQIKTLDEAPNGEQGEGYEVDTYTRPKR